MDMKLYWVQLRKLRFGKAKNEKLIGVIIDRNFSFDDYVFTLCKKAGRKLSALARISIYMSFLKNNIYFESVCLIAFAYCPLTWMFHNKRANSKISHIY